MSNSITFVFTPPLDGDKGNHCSGSLAMENLYQPIKCKEFGEPNVCWERQVDFKVRLSAANATSHPRAGAWYLAQRLTFDTHWEVYYADGTRADEGDFTIIRNEAFRLQGGVSQLAFGGHYTAGPDYQRVSLPYCPATCYIHTKIHAEIYLKFISKVDKNGKYSDPGANYIFISPESGDRNKYPGGRAPRIDERRSDAFVRSLYSDVDDVKDREGASTEYHYDQVIDHCPCPVNYVDSRDPGWPGLGGPPPTWGGASGGPATPGGGGGGPTTPRWPSGSFAVSTPGVQISAGIATPSPAAMALAAFWGARMLSRTSSGPSILDASE